MNKYKVYSLTWIGIALLYIVVITTVVVVVDPYFHFHKPLEGFNYIIKNPRYQNDGITRHFEYDAIITGTSMSENFKTSEMDELFSTKSVKIPFSGASFKEVNDALERALEYNDEVSMVLRTLEIHKIEEDKDKMSEEEYPTYLYDQKLWNDIHYIFNKDFLFTDLWNYGIEPTLEGTSTNIFDPYASMDDPESFGPKYTLLENEFLAYTETYAPLDEETKEIIKGSVEQNITNLAKNNPDITFYYFYPPYSIAYFYRVDEKDAVDNMVEQLKYCTELILQQENIKLYSFFDQYEIITDLYNYKDTLHYGEWINSEILNMISKDEGLLTEENYRERFEEMRTYYKEYDYQRMFE